MKELFVVAASVQITMILVEIEINPKQWKSKTTKEIAFSVTRRLLISSLFGNSILYGYIQFKSLPASSWPIYAVLANSLGYGMAVLLKRTSGRVSDAKSIADAKKILVGEEEL